MSDNEETEIDPGIAAAMGFSGFGSQAKKRKFDHNNGFVDPSVTKAQNPGNGANSTPLGERTSTAEAKQEIEMPEKYSRNWDERTGVPTAEQLRNGVRNKDGDLVVWMPEFGETDPWESLRKE